MSSVQSAFKQIVRPTTKFHAFMTPTYINNTSDQVPIPFTVVNQVLDINASENAEIAAFVANGTEPDNAPRMQGKLMGGSSTVFSFGPNMTTFLRRRIEIEESLGSAYTGPLTIFIQPLMTRMQSVPLDFEEGFHADAVYGISTEAPTSTGFVGGSPTDNYLSFFIFKTPLAVEFVGSGGVIKYLTLTSQISED